MWTTESTKEMTRDRTAEDPSRFRPGPRYRVIRLVPNSRSTEFVVEDLGDGGRRRMLRVVPDRPEIRSAAEAARRVTHDRLIGLHRIESAEDGRPMLVLDVVEGETVAARIRRLGAMHEEQVLRLMTAVARGLDRAHSMGVVHGALRTESIVIDEDGEAVLSGLAVDAALDQSVATAPDDRLDDDVVAFARIIVDMLDGVSSSEPDSGRHTPASSAVSDDPLRSDLNQTLRRAAERVLDAANPRIPRTCGEFLLDVTAGMRARSGAESVPSVRPNSSPVGEDGRFSTPVALLTLESAIADLVPRRPRLRLADHTAIRTAWEKGEHFLSSGSVYKQLQRWEAAGQALEMARAEFESAFALDRRLLASRDRHGRLAKVEASLSRPDHPDACERHASVERMLHPDTGDWWLAWEDGRIDDADRILDEVASILSAGRHRDREIESALRLRARWTSVAAACPERILDQRFAAEIHDHRAAGVRAGEAFDRGRFAVAGGCWSGRLDRFEEVLAEEAAAHDAAVESRQRWEDARSRVPKSRSISRELRESLEGMDTEFDRVERDVFGVGDFDEASRVWTAAASSVGGLVAEDVERFSRVETARESYESIRASIPSRRTCTRLAEDFAAVGRQAQAAAAFREAGDFEEAATAWSEAGVELRRLLTADAAHHRDAMLACERLGRRLEMLPARSLDRSVRADVERARQRYRVMLDWRSSGRFVEVVEAVERTLESIERALGLDSRLHQAAVDAGNQAAAVLLEEPVDVPVEVYARMQSAQVEIDAIALQARQAFDLGEYADCSDEWQRVVDLKRRFDDDLVKERDRHLRQQQRRALMAGTTIVVILLLAGVLGLAAIGYGRLSFQQSRVSSLIDPNRSDLPTYALARRDAILADIGEAMKSPVGLLSAVLGVEEFRDRITQLERVITTDWYPGWESHELMLASLGEIDDLPVPLQARVDDLRNELAALRDGWNAGNVPPAKIEDESMGTRLVEMLALVQTARRLLEDLDEYSEHGQRGVEATAGLPEIKARWEAFNRELASGRDAWQEIGDQSSSEAVEERVRALNRVAIELWGERNRVNARSARDAFVGIWESPNFASIRRAMLDGRRNDVSRLDLQAREAFQRENHAAAERAWKEAKALAEQAEIEHRPAVNDFEKARAAWDERSFPTDTQRTDNAFKAHFNEAENRESEGLDAANAGNFEFAARKFGSALARWNKGLETIDVEVGHRWQVAEDESLPGEQRLADLEWLVRILPAGSDDQRRAIELREELSAEPPSTRRGGDL
jgi:hypothetical protein